MLTDFLYILRKARIDFRLQICSFPPTMLRGELGGAEGGGVLFRSTSSSLSSQVLDFLFP